jgi:hypothetical protein
MRSSKEMDALLAKIDEMIGPLDKWSEDTLLKLNAWVMDFDRKWTALDGETVGPDDESD